MAGPSGRHTIAEQPTALGCASTVALPIVVLIHGTAGLVSLLHHPILHFRGEYN